MTTEVHIGGSLFQVRDLAPTDRTGLLALHTRVFGPGAGDDWYQWKYVDGHGLGTGVWHAGELIAHCGGLPRRLWQMGRAETGLQIGDVMVAPEWRGILTRHGPFFHASQGLYAGHVGARHGHSLAFGFPNERHMRLAVALKLAWDAGPVLSMVWHMNGPRQSAPGWAWHWTELMPLDAGFDIAIDAAWSRMRAASDELILGERDRAYVSWRFCRRPGRTSRFFALRRSWARSPVGIAVLDFSTPQAQWLDWIGEPRWMNVAARACVAQAQAAGASSLMAWATPAVAKFLSESGYAEQTVTARLGIPRASALTEEEALEACWWFMGGDTDFL